jgi:hypothetical protein
VGGLLDALGDDGRPEGGAARITSATSTRCAGSVEATKLRSIFNVSTSMFRSWPIEV